MNPYHVAALVTGGLTALDFSDGNPTWGWVGVVATVSLGLWGDRVSAQPVEVVPEAPPHGGPLDSPSLCHDVWVRDEADFENDRIGARFCLYASRDDPDSYWFKVNEEPSVFGGAWHVARARALETANQRAGA